MDLNGDGHVDILSGSYSRQSADMAGLFQVLWGSESGFAEAATLQGSDGEPLIIERVPEGDDMTVRICTRPSACDLNGDGHLDILSGNFEGTFHVFWGEEGYTFNPESEPLPGARGTLKHDYHSDPFPIDWDGDGDLDIVAGSGGGQVSLALNSGSATEPRFTTFETLIPSKPRFAMGDELHFGHEHIKAPRGSTRVFVADVNGDGVHDVLVGDTGDVSYLLEGKSEEETREAYAKWAAARDALMEEYPRDHDADDFDERRSAWSERYGEHHDALGEIVDTGGRGLVFLYLGSVDGPAVVDAGTPR